MARRRAAIETERTVHFYRANIGVDAAGAPLPFPVAAIAARINELDFATGERYVQMDNDVFAACWVDHHGNDARMRVTNVRRGGLPEMDRAGHLSPLPIPGNAGLAEATHVAFFANNVVGALFNFYGPRLSRLAYYLAVRASDVCAMPRFEPLLRHDVVDRLDDLRRITLFKLKIRRGYEDEIERANQSLGQAFRTAFEAGDGQQAEIQLQAGRRRGSSLAAALRRTASRLARRRDLSDGAVQFVVRGSRAGERQVDEIDVLSDELLLKKTVRLQDERTRAVNTASAYQAIQEAYVQLQPQLDAAAQAGFEPPDA